MVLFSLNNLESNVCSIFRFSGGTIDKEEGTNVAVEVEEEEEDVEEYNDKPLSIKLIRSVTFGKADLVIVNCNVWSNWVIFIDCHVSTGTGGSGVGSANTIPDPFEEGEVEGGEVEGLVR